MMCVRCLMEKCHLKISCLMENCDDETLNLLFAEECLCLMENDVLSKKTLGFRYLILSADVSYMVLVLD